jgi:hypothetical protein
LSFAEGAGPDLRNYKVDFGKIESVFPDLKLRWTVADGIGELLAAYREHGLSHEDFTSSRYVRLRRIEELLAANVLDRNLRRMA